MAILTIEQVANKKRGEKHYYVAIDKVLENGTRVLFHPISPYFSQPEEAKAWQANNNIDGETYCVAGESLV